MSKRVIFILITLTIIVFPMTGCKDIESNLLELEKEITRNIILTASEDWIRPGQEAIFTIKDENPPKDPVYEWDFEDGSGIQWETDTTMRHVFEKAGWYNVCVKLREQGRTQYDYPGYLAVDSIIIHVGHPANLLVPQPPLYAGVKYEFTLGYNGELPTGHDYWWELSNGSARRTDSNTFEWTFPKEGTYTVRGEIRHTVNINAYTSKEEIFAFGQATVSVSKAPELTINVPPPPLQTGKEYTFMANHESPEKLADEPYYEWDFGDGSGIGIPFSTEAIHAFAKEGQCTIRVEVFESDVAGAKSLGVATAKVTVEPSTVDFLSLLRQTNWIEIGLVCPIITPYGRNDAWHSEWAKDNSLGIVQWEGSQFSVTWSSGRHSEIISGDVRQEGSDLYVSLKARHEFDKDPDIAFWEIEISELPLSTYRLVEYGEVRFEGRKLDSDVPQYVTYFNMNDLESVDWSSELSLSVVFDRKTD